MAFCDLAIFILDIVIGQKHSIENTLPQNIVPLKSGHMGHISTLNTWFLIFVLTNWLKWAFWAFFVVVVFCPVTMSLVGVQIQIFDSILLVHLYTIPPCVGRGQWSQDVVFGSAADRHEICHKIYTDRSYG